MQDFFEVLMALLQQDQTVSFLSCVFRTVRRYIYKFADVLFKYQNTEYCGGLLYEILRYTNANNGITRAEAGALAYLMIKVRLSCTSCTSWRVY